MSPLQQYIHDHYLTQDVRTISAAVGISTCAVYKYMRKAGLVTPPALRKAWKSANQSAARLTATPQEDAYIREHYDKLPAKTIGKALGRSWTFVSRRIKALGLTVPAAKLLEFKSKNRFNKGYQPWNTGRRHIRVSPKSEFRKGNKPHNTKYDDCITIRHDRNYKTNKVTPYKYIRLAEAKWELYQRYVWEQHNGPIPKNCMIRFKDNDTLNCDISNLMLVTRRENLALNRNTAKAARTMKIMYRDGEIDNGVKSLADTYVAGILSNGDKELRQHIITNHPHLVALKRKQLLLNRTIKTNQQNEQSH